MALKLTLPSVTMLAICAGDHVARSLSVITETKPFVHFALGLECARRVVYADCAAPPTYPVLVRCGEPHGQFWNGADEAFGQFSGVNNPESIISVSVPVQML